jgi:ABC-type nitrate/sulfonate/bicarbonate transport system substrate-binding protein
MPSMTKIALAAAIVLSTAVAASAAAEHHRVTRGHPPIYNAAPPIISDACQPVGPPCRTHPEGW